MKAEVCCLRNQFLTIFYILVQTPLSPSLHHTHLKIHAHMASANTNKRTNTFLLSLFLKHKHTPRKTSFSNYLLFKKLCSHFRVFSSPTQFHRRLRRWRRLRRSTQNRRNRFFVFGSKWIGPIFFRRILIKFRSDQKKVFWDHQKFLKSFGILSQHET